MKASELIKQLQEKIDEYGDLDVTNSMDSVIDYISLEFGMEEFYFMLNDNGYDICDIQNGFYDI